jgi:hypothetical protein
MAKYGNFEDTMMAHVAPGEQIVPKPVLDANPQLALAIVRAIRQSGVDPEQFRVGSDMDINPYTGHPEFGFFKKLFKVAKAVAPIAVGFIPGVGPIASAAMGAGIGALGGGGIKGAITGGLSGYGGSGLASGLRAAGSLPTAGVIGPQSGTIFGGVSNVLKGSPGAFGALTSGISGGGLLDNASKIMQAMSVIAPQKQSIANQRIGDPSTPAVKDFTPKKQEAMSRPASLNEFAGFSPEQERSALATKGINSGLGAEENAYYINLLNRTMIGDGGEVNRSSQDFLMPIESQYFSRRGKNTSDIIKFLQGIS